ncbi:MAG: hypothetical protein QOH63_1677 [Acidobacteriota bacterium]|jgi:hypothetical protein|nr:hypothetical protein [Acidobacteriota bacterium]
MKKLIQLFVFAALVTTLALPALAQTTPSTSTTTAAAGGQDDSEAKAALYKTFTDNRNTNPPVAYQAAKEYLEKYEAKDGPTDQYIAYIKKYVASYDKLARREQLLQQIKDKKVNEAFASAKPVLADYPDDLVVLYQLSGAGFTAATSKNEANNADAITYTKRVIQLIQSGKSFDPNKPLSQKDKDEILGNLNFKTAFLLQDTAPTEALTYAISAAQFEGSAKKDPNTYAIIYVAYAKTDYNKLKTDYDTNCKTPEQLNGQQCKDLGDKINIVVDHMIDALARAVSYSNSSPNAAQYAQNRTDWMNELTGFYKYRNNNSDTGLKELLAGITSRPLPKPGEPVVPPLTPQTTPSTPSSSTTPTQPSGTATGTPAGKATTTTTPASTKQGTTSSSTSQAGSKTSSTQPAGKTSTTKTTPRRSH